MGALHGLPVQLEHGMTLELFFDPAEDLMLHLFGGDVIVDLAGLPVFAQGLDVFAQGARIVRKNFEREEEGALAGVDAEAIAEEEMAGKLAGKNDFASDVRIEHDTLPLAAHAGFNVAVADAR